MFGTEKWSGPWNKSLKSMIILRKFLGTVRCSNYMDIWLINHFNHVSSVSISNVYRWHLCPPLRFRGYCLTMCIAKAKLSLLGKELNWQNVCHNLAIQLTVTVYIKIDSKRRENTLYLTLGIIQSTTDSAPKNGRGIVGRKRKTWPLPKRPEKGLQPYDKYLLYS